MLSPAAQSEAITIMPGTTRTGDYTNLYPKSDPRALGFVQMYDDKNFSDTSIYCNLYEYNKCYDVVLMKNLGLNDKISSLALTYQGDDPEICSVLTVWEDSYFNHGDKIRAKHKVNFVASYNYRLMFQFDLRGIPCLGSSKSWNDRISSCSFHFGYYGSYPKEH